MVESSYQHMQIFKLFYYGTVNEQKIIIDKLPVTGDYETNALAKRSYHDLRMTHEKMNHRQFLLSHDVMTDVFAAYAAKTDTRLNDIQLEGDTLLREILDELMTSKLTQDEPDYRIIVKMLQHASDKVRVHRISFTVSGVDGHHYDLTLTSNGDIIIAKANGFDYMPTNPAVTILANDVADLIRLSWGL